jgi:hypothetical protein
LPHHIAVDVAPLVSFESVIFAKEIALPSGAVLITNPEEVVISVYEPKEEVAPVAPVDLSAIEVAKKGKEVKEGEAGALAPEAGAGEKDARKDVSKEVKKEPKKEEKKK